MDTILEALLDLNKALCLEGYESDFTITLGPDDFFRLVSQWETRVGHPVYTKDLVSFKMAGPGSYFIIKKRGSHE